MNGKRAVVDKREFAVSLLWGVIPALVVYFVALALSARLVLAGALGEDRIFIAVAVSAFLSAFIGGAVAVRRYKRRAVLLTLAMSVLLFAVLYLVGFIVYDDPTLGSGGFIMLAVMLVAGLFSGFVAPAGSRGKKRKISQKRLKKS